MYYSFFIYILQGLLLFFVGILIGTLTMEMGGKVSINCPKTTYRCELEFKLKVSFNLNCLILMKRCYAFTLI